jgi:hypothetical protein
MANVLGIDGREHPWVAQSLAFDPCKSGDGWDAV